MNPITGKLSGKTGLITDAGQGIGRAAAELYAAEGVQVIASDINEVALAELAAIDGITPLRLDVTAIESIKKDFVSRAWM